MKSTNTPLSILTITLSLTPRALASFNLNTTGPDWDYAAKDLANTTSEACATAYSATIDCDSTLVGLVASMRTDFSPTSTDFDNTCTSSCASSLAAYIAGVQEACTDDGDKAQEYVGGSGDGEALVPVELVGQVFQYYFAKDCSVDANGQYCPLSDISSEDDSASDFPCTDACSVSLYEAAHDFAASAYEFNYYWLVPVGDWWEDEFQKGYERVQDCGLAQNDTGVMTVRSATITATPSASATAVVNGLAGYVSGLSVAKTIANATGSAASTTTSAKATGTNASSGVTKVGVELGLLLVGVICSLVIV